MRADHYESLIASYVNGTLRQKDVDRVESLIASDASFNEIYIEKKQQKDFYLQLIPSYSLSRNTKKYLLDEIKKVNADVFPKEKYHLVKKIKNLLDKPILEI